MLAPPYSIEQTGKIEEVEGRIFVKFHFENIAFGNKRKIPENLFKSIIKRSSGEADNLEKYYEAEKQNHLITINLNNTKKELLEIQRKQESASTKEEKEALANRVEEAGEEIEEDIKEFNKNQEIMQKALESIELWKADIHEYLQKIFADAIMEIELERTKIKKAENLTSDEKEFFVELQKALKSNKEEAETILKRTEDLIKIQQKFAKIAADCGANYVAVSDGFKIREAALELYTMMKNIYEEFEEYYILLTNDGEKNEVKEIRYRKILEMIIKLEY